jgi:hypothetical protein
MTLASKVYRSGPVVRADAGIHCRDDLQKWSFGHAHLSSDEARRIATAIARLPEFLRPRLGFCSREGGDRRWKPSRPYHVALKDSYVRENWDRINALCAYNGIPFDPTGQRINREGHWCVYEFARQISAAVLVCFLPPILELYLPALLRTTGRPTVVISSAPANPSSSPIPTINSTGAVPTPTADQVTLTTDEIVALVEFWNSIKDQMNVITDFTGEGQSLLETWPQDMEKNRDLFVSRLRSMRDAISARRNSLIALMNTYRNYPNVQPILREVSNEGVLASLQNLLQMQISREQIS